MFVIASTYTRPFSRDEAVVAEHLAFVDRCYEDGYFVASGPRQPFTGGLIIAHGDSEDQVRALMQEDPFVRDGVAHYEFMHSRPSKAIHPDLVES
ncbi:YciI family protein [Rhodococcus ruber]|uniref:YCII-related domain-containing protein n=1 Tax=Rhodococcus ruber TaxID=1830 RepID=A0A098BHB0_9NOCA|nr:YciI family protein [Rhodococcus ruber]MCD2129581.1 YciI family protein [Rhodococcus ruber]MCZ4506073.1 YciI family protein [Rhodococcus ruber]MCZ4533174.1 YciI family protein [Rhodococcus ruber]MCZ4623593.1 YciI family protein [Rhodococcus ruber]MDI9970638.1 YciI family protein [Rhodococcus ruber]